MQNNSTSLLRTLEECREICIDFITDNQNSEEHYTIKCVELCRDCEKICDTTATFIGRKSLYTKKILKLCSEICHKCADELLKHFSPRAKECIDMCRYCAQECATAS